MIADLKAVGKRPECRESLITVVDVSVNVCTLARVPSPCTAEVQLCLALGACMYLWCTYQHRMYVSMAYLPTSSLDICVFIMIRWGEDMVDYGRNATETLLSVVEHTADSAMEGMV